MDATVVATTLLEARWIRRVRQRTVAPIGFVQTNDNPCVEPESPIRVGIIGCGTVGRAVADRLASGEIRGMTVAGILTRTPVAGLPAPLVDTVEGLSGFGIVVETASHQAVRDYAVPLLAAGTNFVCTSVGALADPKLRARIVAAAKQGGSRLVIVSGAIGALDLLSAAKESGLDSVVIELRKPPLALLPAEDASSLREPTTVFEGNVGEVVSLFPRTTNIAAAVALAGLGFEATLVRVVADPSLSANRVSLRAVGVFGQLSFSLHNVASANPRTSVIVSASVIATLRRMISRLVFA
jgi:aspartate dehydrogenase